jgi:hypothetical protein
MAGTVFWAFGWGLKISSSAQKVEKSRKSLKSIGDDAEGASFSGTSQGDASGAAAQQCEGQWVTIDQRSG